MRKRGYRGEGYLGSEKVLGEFIGENYAFLFIFAILLFSIFSNLKMERSVRWKFISLAVLLFITHVVTVLEAYYATFPTATFMHPGIYFKTVAVVPGADHHPAPGERIEADALGDSHGVCHGGAFVWVTP